MVLYKCWNGEMQPRKIWMFKEDLSGQRAAYIYQIDHALGQPGLQKHFHNYGS